MSVQLVLYPQTAFFGSNYVVDGMSFSNIVSSYYTGAAVPSDDAIINSPPSIANSWYSYSTDGTGIWGSVAAPVSIAGTLTLFYNAAPIGRTGIYQKLSGLTVGQPYEIIINTSAPVVGGTLRARTYTGSVLQTSGSSGTLPTQIIAPFVANSVNDTILIDYVGSAAILNIESIAVTESSAPASSEYEGQVIVDLYADEDIPITLSVDDFKNVAEKVQSYSKAFNLPATKRNNQIFTNLFEITMVQDVYSFNPYIKTPCLLKQNGFILFDGYLKLIDIQDKEAEISYNVNMYSEAIALADVLKDRSLGDLSTTSSALSGFNPFYELNHDYNRTTIKESWTVGGITYPNSNVSGFRDADTLKYPFVDWNHQMLISDGSLGVAGDPQLTKLEQAFRPFINIKYLINRIFADTDFTWTSTLFDSTDFGNLYMDFNWGEAEDGAVADISGTLKQQDSQGSDWFINVSTYNSVGSILRFDATVSGDNTYWDNSNYKWVSPVNNLQMDIGYLIRLYNTAEFTTYSNNVRLAKFDSLGNHLETLAFNNDSIASEGIKWFSGNVSTTLQAGEYIQAQSTTLTANKIRMARDNPNSVLDFTWTNESAQVDTLLLAAREDIKQWDFLKGIMTMFNLITIPDEDNPSNINFETYNDVFINNPNRTQLDWTDKIDVSEMKLTPLGDLNKKTIFKFVEDDDDYAFNLYKTSVGGHLYGSKEYDASGFTLLEGEEEIVPEPFAATVIKPLTSSWTELIVPSVYALNDDGATEGFANAPRIMYNNGVKTLPFTYHIPLQNSVVAEDTDEFLQFSHLTDIPTVITTPPATTDTKDFHFGECQLIVPIGNPVANNLFNTYWLPYYNELYNPNTRIMILKVNLSPSDINTFKFYDTVFIKNRLFRVNKIDYKPNDLATVEFILIANLGSSPPSLSFS